MPSLAPDAQLLVVSVARIGDTLLGTPVMRALKEACPRGALTVLAHPKRLEVLESLPFIDRLGAIDKMRALWRGRVGPRRYAAAMVFGRERALLDYALRVSDRVVAYDEPEFAPHARVTRVPVARGTHAVEDRLRLAQALGVTVSNRCLAFHVTAAEREEARRRLRQRWPQRGGPVVGLQMCSFPTKAHRDWPVEHFRTLAERLSDICPDVRFIVMGDDYARRMAAPFMQSHSARTLLAAGHTSLRQAGALIAELDLYIGVDTGPTHIAGALGVPMVALYHCQYPGRNLVPLDHPRCRMIEHPLTLDPRCREQGMEAISVDRVYTAAEELLRQPATAGAA
jgi:heptosyltransferase III